eukprot:CAMPEP_0185259856 /NCGR_PEP_ID=MMETSP1359-20130426/8557_1 /TAXON_ID=552665 /ORGANISM="Bigelowiella longifila, Strain CCMP242" /LENGTH=176 /DNA_ID=CAMNT_0027845911 /DNA_START=1101 /DNA_END=1632 /DNA_ORIENTATION=-
MAVATAAAAAAAADHMSSFDPDLLVNNDGVISTRKHDDNEDDDKNDSQQSVSENNSEDSGMVRYVNGDGKLEDMFTRGSHEDVTSDDLTLFLTDDPKNPEKRLPIEAGKREIIDGVTARFPQREATDGDDNIRRKRPQRGRKMDGELTKAEKAARRLKGVGLTIFSGDSSSSILKF